MGGDKITKDDELTIFRTVVGDSPTTRVIEYLIETQGLDFSLTDIAEGAHVSWTTLHRIWANLEKAKLVTFTRRIGNAKLFTLNMENPVAKALVELFNRALSEFEPRQIEASTISA